MKRTCLALLFILNIICIAVAAEERFTETVAPGLVHHVLDKGKAATGPSYHVVLGVFDRQSEADRMLQLAREKGVTAHPLSFGGEYYVITPGHTDRSKAEETRQRLIDKGFSPPLDIEDSPQDPTHPAGPWKIHVLEIDPAKVDVQVAHATDAAIGLETTAALAERRGALAAINGGYFYMTGLFAGDSRGALEIDDRLLSEPDRGRASVGFFDREGATKSVFGRLGFQGWIHLAKGEPFRFRGINRKREPSEIVLFTPDFHRTTLTPPGGAEVVITNSRIAAIGEGAGSTPIPSDGVVLSIGAERVAEVLPRMRVGDSASIEMKLVPLLPDPERDWARTEHIVSGGPLLLWRGNRIDEPQVESISRVFFLARHPRTAVGSREDGTLLFVTVDGREPGKSVGMSIPELTELMLELGCVSAVNLDGGGSTTMVIDGKVVNRPSGGEARRNADAILLFPKNSSDQ